MDVKRLLLSIFITRHNAMHAERDIVLPILSVWLSVCLSVCLSNADTASK